jgi:hypothetical protein
MLDKFDLMNDLRAAVIRMSIEMVQVNTIVFALRHDLITCAQAFEWLETGGLLQYLSAEVGSWPSFGTIKSQLSKSSKPPSTSGNARSPYCPLPAESRANLPGQDAHNGTDGEVRR